MAAVRRVSPRAACRWRARASRRRGEGRSPPPVDRKPSMSEASTSVEPPLTRSSAPLASPEPRARSLAHAQLAVHLDGAVERQPVQVRRRRAGEHLEQRRVTDGAQLGAARALDPQLARVEVPVDGERGGMVAGGERDARRRPLDAAAAARRGRGPNPPVKAEPAAAAAAAATAAATAAAATARATAVRVAVAPEGDGGDAGLGGGETKAAAAWEPWSPQQSRARIAAVRTDRRGSRTSSSTRRPASGLACEAAAFHREAGYLQAAGRRRRRWWR